MYPAYPIRVKRSRRVFVAGKLRPKRERKPCNHDLHVGPMVQTDRYNEAAFDVTDALWPGSGICSACGSLIHESQLRRAS